MPTAAEREFFGLLTNQADGLHDWYLTEPSGLQWLMVSCDVVKGDGVQATWRLDYGGFEIAGGLSPAFLNWDAEMRADAAGVDTSGPDGIRMVVHSPSEAAALAARWFDQRITRPSGSA